MNNNHTREKEVDTMSPRPHELLFALAGPTAGGKTTPTKILAEHFGAPTIRFSTILADFARAVGMPTDKQTLQKMSTALRKIFGEGLLANTLMDWVLKQETHTVIVEGLRRAIDIEVLHKRASESRRTPFVIFVDADERVRLERYNARLVKNGMAPISLETFQGLEDDECENEIDTIRKYAGVVTVDTSRLTIDEVRQRVMEVLPQGPPVQ